MADVASAEGVLLVVPSTTGAAIEAPFVAELQRLEVAIDGALSAEEAIMAEEPESEEPGGRRAEAESQLQDAQVEASLSRLRKALFAAEGDWLPEAEALTVLLGKVWELAATRGEGRRDIAKRLAIANADAQQQSERANRAEATELLESTLARLTAARKALKEREWELTTIRRRLADAEESRYRSEARLRLFETALDKASVARIEALAEGDRKLSEATSRAASIEAEALQRRLCESELEVGKVNAARALAEHRAQALRDQLSTSKRKAEELERQLQEAMQVAAATALEEPAPAPPPEGEVPATGAEAEMGAGAEGDEDAHGEVADDGGDDGDGEAPDATEDVFPMRSAGEGFAPPARPLRAGDAQLFVRGLAGLRGPPQPEEEKHVEGVGIVVISPRRVLRSSIANRGGAGNKAAPLPRPVSPARIERQGQSANQRASPSATPSGPRARRSTGGVTEGQAPSMPMDLRALGKLLTGGGFVGKGK